METGVSGEGEGELGAERPRSKAQMTQVTSVECWVSPLLLVRPSFYVGFLHICSKSHI